MSKREAFNEFFNLNIDEEKFKKAVEPKLGKIIQHLKGTGHIAGGRGGHKSYDQMNAKQLIHFLEQLAQCNEFEYEFLRYQQRVDLNWDTWRKLNEISVDYKDIEPSQRQIYKWTQILKSKF